MKVLSKYFKVALCFMAFALCSFMFAFTPTFTAVQAAELTSVSYDKALNALKMPTDEVNYEDDEEFRIPLLNSTVTSTYTIRVVDPSGYCHDYVVNPEDSAVKQKVSNFFKLVEQENVDPYLVVNAKNDGEYKIIYISTVNNRKYYSNTYKVTVTNASYELDFSTPVVDEDYQIVGNTNNLMPSKLAVSSNPYELPVAYAKITGKSLDISGTDGSVTNVSSLSTDESDRVEIKVTKDGAPQDVATSDFFKVEDGKYYIVPIEAGVYTVEYSYTNSANRPTKTFTINVEESFTASDLKLASTPTMPTVELGKTITLPKITVNAGSEKNVDVNVSKIRIEKETNSNIYLELTNNNFKFDMSPESFNGVDSYDDMVGNYRITYTVVDAYGKTLTETFKVDGVTVSTKPTIKLAYNYETTDSNIEFGAETELKAEYTADAGFYLPAVYVEDAVTTNYSDFIIIRTIKKGSTYYYVDNKKYDEDTGTLVDITEEDKGYNASGDTNGIRNPNKQVLFKFNTDENLEGTYYLEYRVITKQVKERESYLYVDGTSEKYTFKVVSSHTETTPTMEITNLKDRSVKNTDSITVKVSSTDTVDTRLKNAVFTYSSAKTGVDEDNVASYITTAIEYVQSLTTTDGENTYSYMQTKSCHIFEDERFIEKMQEYFNDFAIVEENEDTKNSFDLNLKNKEQSITVVAATINDDGNVATDKKVLTIKDTTDPDAPEMNVYVEHLTGTKWINESNEITEFIVGQGEEVKLPTVYVDDDDKTLILNVMYYIDSPENSYGGIKYLSPSNKKFYYESELFSTEVQAIDGGTITTSETGIYYVAYTATDVAGNTSVMYFTFEVTDTSNPILSVEPVADDITISGNTVTGGKGTVVDFETTLRSADGKNDYSEDANISISIEDNGKGLDYQPSGNSKTSYLFNDYGTYIITISGSYTYTPEGADEAITLTADNKVIKVIIEKQEIEWLGEFDVPEYASKGKPVKLPDIAASNGAVVKVTYTLPGGTSSEAIEAEKVTENGFSYWTFTTNETSKGTYTVTYTATTDEDVLTKTISIKVGDNVAPTLSFNKGELTQNLVYNGESDIEYVLEVNKTNKTFIVKAINNGTEVYSYDIGLVISDKDDTGSVNSNMSWTNLSYELTGDSVTKGETTTTSGTTKTQYLIDGTGSYSLKLTIKDSYDNERTETIDFKVVTESSAKENKDTVVGAVLIVISLVLLAGVILFFTFTGKKGGTTKTKTKKQKVAKVENNEENVVVEEKVEDTKVEETATEVDDEPKSGEVE